LRLRAARDTPCTLFAGDARFLAAPRAGEVLPDFGEEIFFSGLGEFFAGEEIFFRGLRDIEATTVGRGGVFGTAPEAVSERAGDPVAMRSDLSEGVDGVDVSIVDVACVVTTGKSTAVVVTQLG